MSQPKHKINRQFRIVPVMDLATNGKSSLAAAKYHLSIIDQLLKSPGMNTMPEKGKSLPPELQYDINRFYWHLRSFFWELISTFDTLLQWANQQYQLGIREEKVDWSSIEPKISPVNQSEWDQKKQLLQDVIDSPWFFEVRQYRNFSHRAFTFVMTEFAPKEDGTLSVRMNWLVPAREGQAETDLMIQLPDYYKRMRILVENVLTTQP